MPTSASLHHYLIQLESYIYMYAWIITNYYDRVLSRAISMSFLKHTIDYSK